MRHHRHLPAVALAALALASCQGKLVESVDIIPQAREVAIDNGSLALADIKTISVPDEWAGVAANFAEDISALAGITLQTAGDGGDITVGRQEGAAAESYCLAIDGDGVKISTPDLRGLNHALATLQQLILTSDGTRLPEVKINDAPRFAYRGLMLDCARHFWTVDELKETLDQMAFFKLNTLHFHLTDNQAWRFAMDDYPQLTTVGTTYPDFQELSGKYYTKDDIREIVAYAAERGIDVIPEIDLPGHSTALLAAMPQLSCKGGTFEPYPEERPVEKRKRMDENMVCVGNPQTYEFIEDVVDALVEIFPSDYIHLGGDEVPTHVWEKCPRCMALYRKEGMKEIGELQDYFTRQMSRLAKEHGKTMIGWDEINDRHAATPDDMLTVWREDGRKCQDAAIAGGIPMIMCPQHGCYLDWGYAGNSTRKVYEYEPLGDNVPADKASLVKGVQAALWTERIATHDRVELMLYPRLCALSEVMWSPREARDWDSFYGRVTAFYPVFERMGINYYDDDALNEKEFVPTEEKPDLVRSAVVETNIPTNKPYHAEYAFDGRSNSFFWGGSTLNAGDWFKVTLTEAVTTNKVKVVTGDSKDYITKADLMVSEDGDTFATVAQFDEYGLAEADLGGKKIKSVMIKITDHHSCWPIIKEITIE